MSLLLATILFTQAPVEGLPVETDAGSPGMEKAAELILPALSDDALAPAELAAATQIGDTISAQEWIGPLAPVALSPFFGMACLSGLSQFGPDWLVGKVPGANAFLSADSPLKSPGVFWTFAALALLTSLPRLTKVSKPIAGALDQIETYSSIVALLAIRFLADPAGPQGPPEVALAGIGTFSLDVVLAAAGVVNLIVVNSVKFFFEFLVWITPVPFLDACFEAANKSAAAGLMGLYAFSPMIATVVNLVLLGGCLLAFFWIYRQIVFTRHMLLGWLLGLFTNAPQGNPAAGSPMTVFPRTSFGPFAARERLLLEKTNDGWLLIKRSFVGRVTEFHLPETTGRIDPGWITHALHLDHDEATPLLFSRQYHRGLADLAKALRVELAEEAERTNSQLRAELGKA